MPRHEENRRAAIAKAMTEALVGRASRRRTAHDD